VASSSFPCQPAVGETSIRGGGAAVGASIRGGGGFSSSSMASSEASTRVAAVMPSGSRGARGCGRGRDLAWGVDAGQPNRQGFRFDGEAEWQAGGAGDVVRDEGCSGCCGGGGGGVVDHVGARGPRSSTSLSSLAVQHRHRGAASCDAVWPLGRRAGRRNKGSHLPVRCTLLRKLLVTCMS
jgi:hypothetical protein